MDKRSLKKKHKYVLEIETSDNLPTRRLLWILKLFLKTYLIRANLNYRNSSLKIDNCDLKEFGLVLAYEKNRDKVNKRLTTEGEAPCQDAAHASPRASLCASRTLAYAGRPKRTALTPAPAIATPSKLIAKKLEN